MEVVVGIAGKPNAGKSTLFSAMTGTMVAIGDYQFTTTETSKGIAYIVSRCPHTEIHKDCSPRRGKCFSGSRYIPVEILDIPGLIEGSGEGKGMGNQFMDSIRGASAMINLISPISDSKEMLSAHEMELGAKEVENEIIYWFSSRLGSEWDKFCRKVSHIQGPLEEKLLQKVGFFGIGLGEVKRILNSGNFPENLHAWNEENMENFSRIAMTVIRPIKRIVNKGDLLENTEEIRSKNMNVISADYELSIQRAYSAGIINDMETLEPTGKATQKQMDALERIQSDYRSGKINRIQNILTDMIKIQMENVIVYPVYDESKWCDKDGRVLPDAFIMKNTDTALDLAFAVHTEIGEGFIRAINGRNRMILGKNYELKDSDVIRIISK